MEDGGPTASIWLFLILLILDAVIYGFDEALACLNQKEEQRKAEEEHSKKAAKLCRIMEDLEGYDSMARVIITVVNLIAGGYFLQTLLITIRQALETAAHQYGHLTEPVYFTAVSVVSVLLAILVLSYILMVFGVMLPCKIAARKPEKWAYMLLGPVWAMTTVSKPLTGLASVTVKLLMRLLGFRGDRDRYDVTEDEIISMVNEGHEQGVIHASEAEMITNIFEFRDKEAQDIMTNRRDIDAIDAKMTFKEAVSYMLNGSNSRYPVYEENIDHIIGVLHLKDALRKQSQIDPNLPVGKTKDLMRAVRFVPETRKVDDLFATMQSMKLQMVIVMDEYGQTSGLIAMEDILEEIVGNIMDEYDDEEIFIREKGQDEYVIEGKTRLDDLEERFQLSFGEETFETINGYLISKLDHIPAADEKFAWTVDGYEFQILAVENNMISKVLVTRLPDNQADTEKEEKEA